jgi:hypothetical protein
MARRIYYTDLKGKKLRDDALRQMRETRDLIDPDLLREARERIGRVLGDQPPQTPSEFVFDRRKNLATIEKFLVLTAHNKELQRRVHALILSEFQ